MKICYAVNTKNPDGRGGIAMANGTKDALASALRQMMKVKPIDRITVKDIVDYMDGAALDVHDYIVTVVFILMDHTRTIKKL